MYALTSNRLRLVLFSILLMTQFPSFKVEAAAEILDKFPEQLVDGEKYIIYLHGRIIEDKGIRPTHPIFGIYEYHDLLDSFAAMRYTVISEVRKPNTNPQEYAAHIRKQIHRYQQQDKADLNLVGFSKGAVITLLVSSQLDYPTINYAILAGCWQSITEQDMQLSGNILSLYDVSDFVGSCTPLIDKSYKRTTFREEVFDTGKSHGLFFKPDATWQKPLSEWLEAN